MKVLHGEMVNKIQNMRKSTGLDVTDRISVHVTPSERLRTAITKHDGFIRRETLADKIECTAEAGAEAKQWDINGEKRRYYRYKSLNGSLVMALTEKDLRKYEELLLKKRKELLEEMGLHGEKYANTVKESTGDHSSYSYHMADQGTDNMERELAFMFASKSGRLVYHIDMALKRIKDGTYGACHTCGKQIKKARLEAVPHARYCIECKSAEEDKKAGRR